MSGRPLMIECRHGKLASAVVCRHHVDVQDQAVGFVENSSEPDDLRAWCDQCEAFFEQEGELSEDFRPFNDFARVCIVCYSELKAKHSNI